MSEKGENGIEEQDEDSDESYGNHGSEVNLNSKSEWPLSSTGRYDKPLQGPKLKIRKIGSRRRKGIDVPKEQIRHFLLSEFRKGNSARSAINEICKMFGEGTMSISQGQRWFQRFRAGNFNLENEPKPGRPKEFNNEQLRQLVDKNPSLSVEALSKLLQSSHSTVHRHLKLIGKVCKQGQWISPETLERQKSKEK